MEEERYNVLVVFFLINLVVCILKKINYNWISYVCFFVLEVDLVNIKVLVRREIVFFKLFGYRSVYEDFRGENFIDFCNREML